MEYLKVWTSFRELLEPLTDAERGRLFVAMLEYAESGTEPQLSGNERYVWPSARQSINNTRDKSEQMKANGSKQKQTGANESKAEQTEANANSLFDKDKDKEKDKDNLLKETPLKGGKEKRERFSPPSVDEVRAYCAERKNSVDAQRFVDFYASKGWKVGQNPMKDWKAAVRTWEQRDEYQLQAPRKQVSAQQYEQRTYTEEDLERELGVNDIFAKDWKGAAG